jgi:hypothetical protein
MIGCKQLSRRIKKNHYRYASSYSNFAELVPDRAITDLLVSAYLETFEKVFRVLLVPSFLRQYNKYFTDPGSASTEFVITLLLVISIGRCFNGDIVDSHAALRWIHAANAYVSTPFEEKSHLTTEGIQIYCLLLIAREVNSIGADLIWLQAGSLLRMAMYMGLHRDPAKVPGIKLCEMEMRKRLWATIMEIGVQASLTSGGVPLISESDYDCPPPSNFDDYSLEEGAFDGRANENTFTSTTIQIYLRRLLEMRLLILNLVNGANTDHNCEAAKNLSEKFLKIYSDLTLRLEGFGDFTGIKPSVFQTKLFELLNKRFLLALHGRFASIVPSHPSYYYSKALSIDISLDLLKFKNYSEMVSGIGGNVLQIDFSNLAIYSNGLYRSSFIYAFALICAELFVVVENKAGISVSSPQQKLKTELLNSVKAYVEIMRRRVEHGDLNVKAYAFISGVIVQIDCIERGFPYDDSMLKQIQTSLTWGYERLQRHDKEDVQSHNLPEVVFNTPDSTEAFNKATELSSFEDYSRDPADYTDISQFLNYLDFAI